MPSSYEFTYLQLYTRWSAFGGLAEIPELAGALLSQAPEGVAATLTDTFTLASFAEWRKALNGTGITPLAGLEIGLSYEGARSLPYSLLLLPESREGYANLCNLASRALHRAGANPLTAWLDLNELSASHTGLIAISPYYGGPVTSALKPGKSVTEAKNRAQALRDIFGPDHFFLGVSPLSNASTPNAVDSDSPAVKLNAMLVKLARDLKIGLVGTGEARYPSPGDATAYTALRGRMSRAISSQYPPASLQRAQVDWLYAPHPVRPSAALHLRTPAELVAYYNNGDWPGALANNRLIGERLAAWQSGVDGLLQNYQGLLRARCELALHENFPEEGDKEKARLRLEMELAAIEELGLAESFLAAARFSEAGRGQVVVVRWLGQSFAAYLLGLNRRMPSLEEAIEPEAIFESYAEAFRNAIRLTAGRDGRERLLEAFNRAEWNTGLWQAAPVATASSETASAPVLHPRLALVSLDSNPVMHHSPLLLADGITPGHKADSSGMRTAALAGHYCLPGTGWVEITESKSIAWLQLSLDILNGWRAREKQELLAPADLPVPQGGGAEDFERDLIRAGLEYMRVNHPGAYYAAALEVAEPEKRAGVAEAARQAEIKLLPPDVPRGSASSVLEDEKTVRVGLELLLPRPLSLELEKGKGGVALDTLEKFAQVANLPVPALERLAWSGALDAFGPRPQMAAIAPTLAAYAQAYRESERQRQVSRGGESVSPVEKAPATLFDLLGDYEEVEISAPELPSLDLPEVAPLTRLELLRRQRRALGFYTAEHPLWDRLPQVASDASRSDPLDLSVVLEDRETAGVVLVTGMVIGIRRLPGSAPDGKGEELTVARLEDWSGQAELLVPPSVSQSGVTLEEGAAISALVRRVVPPGEGKTAVLLAEALGPYPPTADLAISDEEAADLALAADLSDVGNGETREATAAPPQDEGWSNSLFAEYGANSPSGKPAEPAPANSNKGKGSKKTQELPKPQPKHLHITLPRTDDPDRDMEIMVALRAVLEKFPGEDDLFIYLPKEGGGYRRFRPQTLSVAFSPLLVHEVEAIAGPDSIKVEE